MSGYTIGEIAGWLVIAAALGFALGWLARELVTRRRGRPAVTAPVDAPAPGPVEAGPHPGSAVPLDGGESPSPDFVVKVSRGSKIYHAPSSPAYGRTTAALWFESPEAAESAGFRRPKNA
ncbi:MAG: hypothetical protein ABWX74_19855 [Aeromicrobium sp.]